MDIRFLLVLLLPALATAGTYSADPMTFGTGYDGKHLGYDYKNDGEDIGYGGSMGTEALEGSAYAHAAAAEYVVKAKTVEQSAKWFRNLLNEKQMILAQVKKRAKLLRALAAESMRSAEQYRKSAAEKFQTSKTLETKARELESLSKEQAILAGELRVKTNSEMKQYVESVINKDVAETNFDTNLAQAERYRTWGAYLEKQAQDMISEAVKWERTSAESLDKAKKLKTDASAESAKAKELERRRKEAEDAANEADKKVQEFLYYQTEFFLKSKVEDLLAVLAKIKAKYLQSLVASLLENASYLEMFAEMEEKDRDVWEKRTASIRAEAKLLEDAAKKMRLKSEKLKASLKKEPSKTKEKKEEASAVKTEPLLQPKIEAKSVEVPKIVVPQKKGVA